jgi:hypothetical protein
MFAVWNGKKLQLVECENKSSVIFAAAKKACNNAHLEMMPMSYLKVSRMMYTFHLAGIAVLCDENGMNKKLPVTLKLDNFQLVGPVLFLGRSEDDFVSLTDDQVNLLNEQFSPLTKDPESEITVKVLDKLIKYMDKLCEERGITRDEYIETLILNDKEYGY